MKIKNFEIKNLNETVKEVKKAYRAAVERKAFKPKKGVYFTSLEAARNFLTPKRIELLHVIKERLPRSLYELAKQTGRSFPSVLKDIEILKKHGLITIEKPKGYARNNFLPHVDYDAISLRIGV